jgi:hypothetical protein
MLFILSKIRRYFGIISYCIKMTYGSFYFDICFLISEITSSCFSIYVKTVGLSFPVLITRWANQNVFSESTQLIFVYGISSLVLVIIQCLINMQSSWISNFRVEYFHAIIRKTIQTTKKLVRSQRIMFNRIINLIFQ